MNLSRPQKLKIAFAATVLVAAGIEGTVLAQHHRAPAGRDAFLNYQVDSTDELVATLKSNKTLRQRYARHFGIPEDRVIAFVKEALVPYRVPRNCVVTDHGVTKAGRIYPVKVTLKKGTRVWATRSGLPILKWACANPVAKTMPGTLMAARPRFTKAPLGQPTMELASNYPTPLLAPLPDADASSPETITPETVDTSALTVPPSLTTVSSASLPPVVAAPLSGGGKGGPGIAPFMIPAIIAVAASNGGGSSPTDNTIKTPTGSVPDITVQVPTGGTTPTDTTPPGGGTNGGGPITGGTNDSGNGNGTPTNGGDTSGGTNGTPTNGGDTNGGTNGTSTNGGDTNGGTNSTGGNNSPGGDNTGGGTTGGGNNGGSPTVPEPGTLMLFTAAGLPALAAARKRFAKK